MAAELVLTEVWDEALAFLLLLKRLVTVIYYFPQAKQLRDFTGGRNAPLRLKVSQKQTQWSVDSKKWRFFHGWSWWSLCVGGGGTPTISCCSGVCSVWDMWAEPRKRCCFEMLHQHKLQRAERRFSTGGAGNRRPKHLRRTNRPRVFKVDSIVRMLCWK